MVRDFVGGGGGGAYTHVHGVGGGGALSGISFNMLQFLI